MKTRSVILIVVATVIVTALAEYALLRGAFWSRFRLFTEESRRANTRIENERSQKEHAYKIYHALSEAYRHRDAYLNTLSADDRSLYSNTVYDGGMNIRNGQYEVAFASNAPDDKRKRYIIHVILNADLSLSRVSHGPAIK